MLKVILLTILFTFSFCQEKQKEMSLYEQIKILTSKIAELEKEIAKNNIEKKTTTEVSRITSSGYSNLLQKSEFQRLDDLESQFYGEFLDDFLESQGIIGKLKDEFKKALLTVSQEPVKIWKVFKFIFSDKKSKSMEGALGYLLIIAQKTPQGNINFVSTKVSSTFKMFPDLVIIKETTTINDQVVKEETIVQTEEKKMKEEDLQNLLAYFELICLKKLDQNVFGNLRNLN